MQRFITRFGVIVATVAIFGTFASVAYASFNYFNGTLNSGQRKYEGTAHNTTGTRVDGTGPFACTGVTGNYFVCSDSGHYGIEVRNYYAQGDPNCGDNDYSAHYYHCYWYNT